MSKNEMEKHGDGSIERPSSQVIIFGTRTDGAGDLANDLTEYLDVNGQRVSVEVCRDVDKIRAAIEESPRGVIVLPHMRQFDPDFKGWTVPAPTDFIEHLCDENGIPYVRLEEDSQSEESNNQIGNGLRRLLGNK